MKNTKTKLSLGVAGIALAAGFSTPSQAACTVSADTVTCDALSTVTEVEAALASVAGDDVTLINESTGEIVQPDNIVNIFRTGAIAVDNAGDVGTAAAPVGIEIRGDVTESGNTVDFVNSGTITDAVIISNIGGDVAFVSTGDIQSTSFWGVRIEGVGAIDVQIDGSVGTVTDGVTPSNLRGVGAYSRRFVPATSVTTVDTVGTATVTTTTSAPGNTKAPRRPSTLGPGQMSVVSMLSRWTDRASMLPARSGRPISTARPGRIPLIPMPTLPRSTRSMARTIRMSATSSPRPLAARLRSRSRTPGMSTAMSPQRASLGRMSPSMAAWARTEVAIR